MLCCKTTHRQDGSFIVMVLCNCRLRAHSSSSSHGTSMAGPFHRYIQTPIGGVLRLPRATEGPRLSEWSIILKHEISVSHGVRSHLLSSSPFLYEHWDIFPGRESAERRPTQAERGEAWPVGTHSMKTCRNNERLYINQFLKRHAKTVFRCSLQLSETIHRLPQCELTNQRLQGGVSHFSLA